MATTSRNIRRYYLSFNLNVFAMGLVGVFINLYFFSTGSYVDVIYYQIFAYLFTFVAFALSGYLMNRYRPNRVYMLGSALFIFLLIDLLSSTGFLSSAIVFGAAWGVAIGMFYAGNNVIMFDITERANRTNFVATNNALGGLARFFAPIIAGALIEFSALPGTQKFFWDFAITAVFLLLSIYFIIKVRDNDGYNLNYSLKKDIIRGRDSHIKFSAYFALDALFVKAFGIILPIYVFQITRSYLIAGIFAGFIILLGMVTNFVFRKGFRADGPFVNIAVPGMIISSLVLLFPSVISSLAAAFVFGGLYTIFSTPLDNAVLVNYMKFLDKNRDINREMFWVNREFYLMMGRMAVLLPMLLIAFFLTNTMDFVFIIPVLSLYAPIYYKLVAKGRIKPLFFIKRHM